ncbi:MAG: GGDEF domain-containing protein, partial [Desulfobacteraceae bacterium]|nr:GGDEF domain-containing protein [Desulfobacteraceae bacterium]
NARKEAIRAVRYQHPLYLFFLDIDHFKHFNDLNGHPAGDVLLVQTASLLLQSIRENIDSAYRFGGDEFVLLLPHLPDVRVLAVANRIRVKYSGLGFEPTSLSIGVARFSEKTGNLEEDIQDMIQRSDAALYHAKKQCGRDTVYVDEESR